MSGAMRDSGGRAASATRGGGGVAPVGPAKATVARAERPTRFFRNAAGRLCADFGRDAFGWLEIDAPRAGLEYFIVLGEHLLPDGTINRAPGQCVRVVCARWHTEKAGFQRVPLPPDPHNSFPAAEGVPIPVRPEFGVVMPFRAAEIHECGFPLDAGKIRRLAVSYPADRDEASFECDDDRLNKVWDFCRHSMFATSFAGQFVDGDRERIPYEADAFASQMNWYAVSSDCAYPRKSVEHLYSHPTWPTEFRQVSVLSAWADWMWSGDDSSLRRNYATLKSEKLLLPWRCGDGLLRTGGERRPWPHTDNALGLADIVDWPKAERDDFDFREVNAVVNAFHYRSLLAMRDIAAAIGEDADAAEFGRMAHATRAAFRRTFFDPATGLFVDGEGSRHSALHPNALALAFGLAPPRAAARIADWLVERGMACSVYFAMYLLKALYAARRADAAFRLLVADGDRGWLGMMRMGATITAEAWNMGVKPNMDWNHSWGATALSAVAWGLLGVRPLAPGFSRILVAPQPGPLKRLRAVVPTRAGPVRVELDGGSLHVESPSPC